MSQNTTPDWFDRLELDQWLRGIGRAEFADSVQAICAGRLDQPTNGDLRRWVNSLAELPSPSTGKLQLNGDRVSVVGSVDDPDRLREILMRFHPWRKGPLEFFGHFIDTEWRSDWKWNRIAEAVDFQNQTVLDVGCGNGYYGWKMLGAGASMVVGCDPILRFLMQFEVFNRYTEAPRRHFVIPLIDTDLPEKLNAFDVVVSAGVLYHRTSPIDHLRSLVGALVDGGTLVVETLILRGEQTSVLVPEDRYAQMRNVWFLPTIPMLKRWFRRTGLSEIQVVDITATTTQEQRSTEWMTFQSLADFLDPHQPTKTIEGYQAPVRAILTARKKGSLHWTATIPRCPSVRAVGVRPKAGIADGLPIE